MGTETEVIDWPDGEMEITPGFYPGSPGSNPGWAICWFDSSAGYFHHVLGVRGTSRDFAKAFFRLPRAEFTSLFAQ